MTTHSNILAWKIPWTEEPGGLQSMALQKVGYDWATEHIFRSIIMCIVHVCVHNYVCLPFKYSLSL